MAELLVVPALLAYGEAAVAYMGELRRPGAAGRLATWGVRIGWLLQTALLVVQASRSDGFPWGTWAGALNLFVWLVVGAYLIWGCRPGYRLLGLAVLPPVALLLAVAWLGGGTDIASADGVGVPLALHVALMLAAFAGFTLAAGLAALYLWQTRRLKRRDARLLWRRLPPLEALDRFSARTVAVSLAVLSAGILAGAISLEGAGVDAAMVVSVLIWTVFATTLVLRREVGLRGSRAAQLVLIGFALVAVVLPLTHFAAS
jgi:ABC-type uncharacterized transport system permease subunit